MSERKRVDITAPELFVTAVSLIVLGAAVGWAMWGTPMLAGRAITSSAAAAWVQALGVVMALWLTFWIARRDARERRQQATARARTAALSVLIPLRALQSELEWTNARLLDGIHPREIGSTEEGPFGVEYLRPVLKKAAELVPLTADMTEAAPAVQAALRSALDLYEEIGTYYDEYGWPDDMWSFNSKKFRRHTQNEIGVCGALVGRAVTAVEHSLPSDAELSMPVVDRG